MNSNAFDRFKIFHDFASSGPNSTVCKSWTKSSFIHEFWRNLPFHTANMHLFPLIELNSTISVNLTNWNFSNYWKKQPFFLTSEAVWTDSNHSMKSRLVMNWAEIDHFYQLDKTAFFLIKWKELDSFQQFKESSALSSTEFDRSQKLV